MTMLSGCQTTRTPRAASEYLFSTDKSQTQLLEDIKAKLIEHKYSIRSLDVETGFLTTYPRRFSVGSGSSRIIAQQTIQIRQEGGGVKLRSYYECEYDYKGKKEFEACIVEDKDATEKIRRVESAMLKMIKGVLYKHATETNATEQ